MKLAVLVIGDGRNDYLAETMRSLTANVLHPISARCMVNDEAHPSYCQMLDDSYPNWSILHTHRKGMAGAVQAGFDLCLDKDPDFVLWIEEDMVLTRALPIREAANRLQHDSRLAQMVFKREVIPGDGADDQLKALLTKSAFPEEHLNYATQDFIFSLNPCLIPRSILELGYDPGNEAGMTEKLLTLGFVFGVWGRVGDDPYARHIGNSRSASWRL